MKFKVDPGSPIYDNLRQLRERGVSVIKQARALVKELGGKEYCSEQNVAWGGIAAIQFESKPEGWKQVGQNWQRLYYPKAANKEVSKKIAALPTVSYKEVNDVVAFSAPQTVSSEKGIGWVQCVGLTFGKDYILISVTPGAKYDAPVGVVEILESEYEKLAEEAEKDEEEF